MQLGSSSTNIQYVGANQAGAAIKSTEAAGEFSFWDVLDVINPLQHIPILSNIYREISGDTMTAVANIAGSMLFGGPVGGGIAVASEIAKDAMGEGGETQTALVETQKAAQAYGKMRVTTADWLNPNFGIVA
jgi:hypothetical protein